MNTVWAHLRLARPLETTFTFAGTLIGAHLARVTEGLSLTLPVAVSNALLCAGSMILNDWHDLTEDAVNKPHRPISAGFVPRKRALVLALSTFALAISLAFTVSLGFGFGACAVVAASVAYSLELKDRPFSGNVLVALLTAYPMWCWWLVVPVVLDMFAVVTVGFFVFRIGGELVKTAEDLAGDSLAGLRTVATLRGAVFTNRLGFGFMAVGLVLAGGPLYYGQATIFYLALLLSSVAALFIAGALGLVSSRHWTLSNGQLVAVHRSLLFAMAIALVFGVRMP